jgi:multiphosphoryl transfer protein
VIGVVVVSHSAQLAKAAVELASEMVRGGGPRLAVAAGVYDGSFGTDATRIAEAIGEVASPDGVLVLVDLGSAVLSAGLALELIDLPGIEVRVTSAPFVEGLMAGLVVAAAGGSLDEVEREALSSLDSKRGQLGDPAGVPVSAAESGEFTLDLRLRNPSGLHIRPASMIVSRQQSDQAAHACRPEGRRRSCNGIGSSGARGARPGEEPGSGRIWRAG